MWLADAKHEGVAGRPLHRCRADRVHRMTTIVHLDPPAEMAAGVSGNPNHMRFARVHALGKREVHLCRFTRACDGFDHRRFERTINEHRHLVSAAREMIGDVTAVGVAFHDRGEFVAIG